MVKFTFPADQKYLQLIFVQVQIKKIFLRGFWMEPKKQHYVMIDPLTSTFNIAWVQVDFKIGQINHERKFFIKL